MPKLGCDIRHEDISGLTLECLCSPGRSMLMRQHIQDVDLYSVVERSSFLDKVLQSGQKSRLKFQFSGHPSETETVGVTGSGVSVLKELVQITMAYLGDMYSLEKSEQSLLQDKEITAVFRRTGFPISSMARLSDAHLVQMPSVVQCPPLLFMVTVPSVYCLFLLIPRIPELNEAISDQIRPATKSCKGSPSANSTAVSSRKNVLRHGPGQ
ncbi:hypothetical protein GWK47_012209 [Chionoecetes opilio]|uniref:Uncharacterized protein n=1 Tax=Chionoecetes opilio TaxID=41210 RepID=A0A8J4XXG3_CHIOP|nr:hypothetical protein GWK47_012209 [Chionoecetes opilio]